ncbi:MAG: MerR family transcriptional regulator [Lachnospiraceae bacterium]|jgi:DNA-binding transcriptional MerR regulator|nr:MerR family transcriptional regulator [Lachnospiraceae bacterium]
MEYTINKLAQLAKITTRTLRYYDQCGLLVPTRISNGYRIYGQPEVDRLQQILLYRELDMPLEEIAKLLSADDYSAEDTLHGHLTALVAKRSRLDQLISNVEKTIKAKKGELIMSDQEKFKGFINNLVDKNEEQYGDELRQKYDKDTIEASNAKVRGMTAEQYAETERLSAAYQEALKEAFSQGDPASETAQKACDLHRQWLSYFWPEYSREAHLGVTQMYVDDERFGAYYDKIAPGCAVFLRDAVAIYCGEEKH